MHPDPDAMRNELVTARAASRINHERSKEYIGILEDLMKALEDTTSPLYSLLDSEERFVWLQSTDEWKAASHVLGWDIDWDALAEAREGQR